MVPRFAPMREGGPGTIQSLLALSLIGCILVFLGISSTESDGIGSAGPSFILLGFFLFAFLVIWIFIKGILRQRDVTFVIHEKGIEIIPSALQSSLDTGMAIISRVLFWFTWKGGQWSAWEPYTPWNAVRKVTINEKKQEILIYGGNWDIRLVCPNEIYPTALCVIKEHKPKKAVIVYIE